MDHHVGLLVVHGIGEQQRFETTRQIGRAILAGLRARGGKPRFSLVDRASNPDEMPMSCPRIDRQGSPFMISHQPEGSDDRTYVHLHEVWWSDLGAPATVGEQVRFWLWALGQWLVPVIWRSHYDRTPSKPEAPKPEAPTPDPATPDPASPAPTDPAAPAPEAAKKEEASNTDLLMKPPTKFASVAQTGRTAHPRPATRAALFLTGLYALLTLFSWEALKRAFAWVSPYAGSPAILTNYVGDVRIYTQAPGEGGGNITDLGQPWRATIRRRMISQMVAMAERDYDRWYVMAHSLGSVVAWNGVQEPDWNLPNYLDPAHVARIRAGPLMDTLWVDDPPPTGASRPNLGIMMPRRPVWLGANDRISRKALFKAFGGLVTYGSPLNKFAALWPRIVPINRDRSAFPADADWVNLSDVTDPVGANLTAFKEGWSDQTPAQPSPHNIRVRASAGFLLSHIRYFGLPARPERSKTTSKIGLYRRWRLGRLRRARKTWKLSAGYRPETRALVDLLFPPRGPAPRLGEAFADVGNAYRHPRTRAAWSVLSIASLGLALLAATTKLLEIVKRLADGLFASLTTHWPHWAVCEAIGLRAGTLEQGWRALVRLFSWPAGPSFGCEMLMTLSAACVVLGAAGLWRMATEK